MQLIDTHAHLYLNHFDKDRDEVIKKAMKYRVEKIILPNIDSSSVTPLKNLCQRFPNTFLPLMGLHPTSVKQDYRNELEIVVSELKQNQYYGIGEIGIDLYWDKTYLKEQISVFQSQIKLALEYDLPIIIHARESFDEIFSALNDFKSGNLKGIFHAFTGTQKQGEYIINNYGFKLGIGGIITFKNSGLDKVVEKIGLNHLVLETDSPYLAPVPFRGKRNESSYLSYIAEKIAEIHQTTPEKIAEITTQNAYEIFNSV